MTTTTTPADIEVVVGGEPRRFTLPRMNVAQALAYVRMQKEIADAVYTACEGIDADAASVLCAEFYLHGIAPMLAEVVLANPADDGPALTVADAYTLDASEPMRILGVFEDLTGIAKIFERGQDLLLAARATASRRMQTDITRLEAEAQTPALI